MKLYLQLCGPACYVGRGWHSATTCIYYHGMLMLCASFVGDLAHHAGGLLLLCLITVPRRP